MSFLNQKRGELTVPNASAWAYRSDYCGQSSLIFVEPGGAPDIGMDVIRIVSMKLHKGMSVERGVQQLTIMSTVQCPPGDKGRM
jgi:hypothetical protein